MQIKALHQDYVALQKQAFATRLQKSSKEVQTFIKLVQQKTGQSIFKVAEVGYTLFNMSGSHIFYKPENSGEALRLEIGGKVYSPIDGIATSISNTQVLKVSDLNIVGSLGLTVYPGGLPACVGPEMPLGLLELLLAPTEMILWSISFIDPRLSGWKDRAWLESTGGDGWRALFDMAATF